MRVDMREHAPVREQVRDGFKALLVQGRQIWGGTRHGFPEIVTRLTVGVGDLARLARDGEPGMRLRYEGSSPAPIDTPERAAWSIERKKELGNILFSTIRWIDDLGLDPLECLDLAIETQEKFAKSGRPR
jgi:hypothetical protein